MILWNDFQENVRLLLLSTDLFRSERVSTSWVIAAAVLPSSLLMGGHEPGVCSSPHYAASIPTFSLQIGSPVLHIVTFWILVASIQLCFFWLTYYSAAKMWIWQLRVAVAGIGRCHACWVGPTMPNWTSQHGWKMTRLHLGRRTVWSNLVLDSHYSHSLCKVCSKCGHGGGFSVEGSDESPLETTVGRRLRLSRS